MAQPILQFDHITKSFFGVPALQDVSLTAEPGKLLGIIGENGAGKSTLMNILGGVIRPDQGRMELYGKHYRPVDPSQAKQMGIATRLNTNATLLTEEKSRDLIESGLDEKVLDRVQVPIGSEVGAETVEEIAVSIMSEVIRSVRSDTG